MDNVVYVGSNGNDHMFHCLADGDRPVLEVYVRDVVSQSELPIRINAIGAPLDNVQETLGVTHAEAEFSVKDGAPGLTSTICIGCIATYIVPRTATMMARVYVPRNENIKA